MNAAVAQAGEAAFVPSLEEDSDDWLTVDPETFDEKLAQTMNPAKNTSTAQGQGQDAMSTLR